jgi:CheY-like chemotaxis protein
MGAPTILIVEDDDISIFVLQKMLKDRFNVQAARNSKEAKEMIEQEGNQSLVLMDINLGEADTDGTSLMQEIRARFPELSTVFVAVTSYAMAGDRAYFLDQGFEDYIPKPVDREHLLETINTYL